MLGSLLYATSAGELHFITPQFKVIVDESDYSQLPIFYHIFLSIGFPFKNQKSAAGIMVVQHLQNFLPPQPFQPHSGNFLASLTFIRCLRQ
jgi:hypothetical protein